MNMNWQGLKKGVAGATLAVALLLGSGAILETTAQAQNRDRDWNRDGRRDNDRRDDNRRDNNRDWNRDGRRDNDRRDNNRDWERRRAEERARAIQRTRELEWRRQQELARRRNNGYNGYGYGYPRNYPNGGYIGGGRSYGYNSYDEQRGFRDGLDRGQEDLRDRRRADPNNSDHFRSGNAAYREGFRRGYAQGYRQYGRW
jgi:hypothetical protein